MTGPIIVLVLAIISFVLAVIAIGMALRAKKDLRLLDELQAKRRKIEEGMR